MGGPEIIVILIVALLCLGPDKLPGAAKTLSKGIRDIKRASKGLTDQIESDEQIGGAIRDLKSALRGEELPVRKKKIAKPVEPDPEDDEDDDADERDHEVDAVLGGGSEPVIPSIAKPADLAAAATPVAALTFPPVAGEPGDADGDDEDDDEGDDKLAAMVKPAAGAVGRGRSGSGHG